MKFIRTEIKFSFFAVAFGVVLSLGMSAGALAQSFVLK
jgi:hypothetical protein